MKEVKDMTKDELLNYFINKILGASFGDIARIFERNEIDSETKRFIMSHLEEIDKKQKVVAKKEEHSNQRKGGVLTLLGGILVVILGFVLFFTTVKVGFIFYFNFFVWAVGAFLIIRGVLNLIAGIVKKV
jgi:predicted phage tail protein